MKNLAEDLKNKNLKVTPQRLIIYSYLSENHTHPSAETIYNHIKETCPNISLSTVYKTLKSLIDVGLIQEINMGEDSFRYDIMTEPHSHIVCNECGSIIDYFPNNDLVSKITSEIKNEISFSVSNQQMFFYGLCNKCFSK